MMHERGKSDFAVRAVKPANKAERSAAELVEQRAGTKGNADQQSTRRAQERESVSQALGRIGEEQFAIHRPIDDHRGHHFVVPQRRHEGDGFPVAKRHVINQSLAARGVAVEPHHVDVDAGFIDKNQPGGVKQTLLADPPTARLCHVGALLFGGAQAFFLRVMR